MPRRLAGYAEALLRPGETARTTLLRDMGPELASGLLLEPVEALERTLTLLRLAVGRFGGWAPQPRAARQVTWAAALRRFWLHAILGLALATGFAAGGVVVLLTALPALAGLLLAVPLAVWTARLIPSGGTAPALSPAPLHLPANQTDLLMRLVHG